MFVVTLKKAGLKKVGVGVLCCALVVFSAMLGRYISGRSVMAAAAASGNKIESAQDIQTWFTGYGLDVDAATIAADKVKIPRRWDDSFSAFNGVVQRDVPFALRYSRQVRPCPSRSRRYRRQSVPLLNLTSIPLQ